MNINDYVADHVVKYLEERDEYIHTIEDAFKEYIRKIRGNRIIGLDETWNICTKCDGLIMPYRRIKCVCESCANGICEKCSLNIDVYCHKKRMNEHNTPHFYKCDECNEHLANSYMETYNKI